MSVLFLRRGRVIAVAAALVALLAPSAAMAITNGTPTEADEYAYVGSFVVEVTPLGGEPYLLQLCTGTMMSPRVVLTASHCMDTDAFPSDWGTVSFTLEKRIGDGTSWELDPALVLLSGTPVPHPDYTGLANYRYDVGAFVLDTSVSLVEYGRLATKGYLDDTSLRATEFTTVGYGIERVAKTKSTQAFLPPKERMLATQPLVTVHRDFVLFSMNLARGFGGTCYGDSGGPHFNANDEIVAVTTTGDIPCKASDQSSRTDTEYALDFIGDVIDSPEAFTEGR